MQAIIPTPSLLNLRDPGLAEQIAGIPNTPGIYMLTPECGLPYLGWSGFLAKRLRRLLIQNPKAGSPITYLCENLKSAEYWSTGSKLETSILLYKLARRCDPTGYRKRLKLRDPWFVCLLLSDRFPRLAVRNRIPGHNSAAYGPFPSRETAERFEQEVQSLFQTRRCRETLAPSEQHPGCIYGEMNLCLRPCQKAVSDGEYAAEVARVSGFLESNGNHTIAVLTSARDRASERMDFEEASRLHGEQEKIKAVKDWRDQVVAEVDALNGLALTRAQGNKRVTIWIMLSGFWQSPLTLDFSDAAASRSMDAELRERLRTQVSQPLREGIRREEIALLSKWYYSSSRDGSWFTFRTLADLNYRKLVRGISNLLRGERE